MGDIMLEHPAKYWYKNTREYLQDKYGPDWQLVTLLIAAISPRKQLKANLNAADLVYRYHKSGQDWTTIPGLMPIHKDNIKRVFDNIPLTGLKVPYFADAILGNKDAVVIDTWIIRYFKHPQKYVTQKQFGIMKEKILHNASRCGLTPVQYQAIIWIISRKKGINGKSFKRKYSLQDGVK